MTATPRDPRWEDVTGGAAWDNLRGLTVLSIEVRSAKGQRHTVGYRIELHPDDARQASVVREVLNRMVREIDKTIHA